MTRSKGGARAGTGRKRVLCAAASGSGIAQRWQQWRWAGFPSQAWHRGTGGSCAGRTGRSVGKQAVEQGCHKLVNHACSSRLTGLVSAVSYRLISLLSYGLSCLQQSAAPAPNLAPQHSEIRHDWSRQEVEALFALPFNDLLFQAQTVHRQYFDPNQVQVSTLLSIKTGACPEDCAYCPQSTRYDTGLEVEKLMEVEKVLEQARAAGPAVPRVSVWAPPGAAPSRATCPMWWPWSKVCASWAWRAA